MKCPKCNYVSHDYLDACRKCGIDLVMFKQDIGLVVLQPGVLDLSLVLGGAEADDLFASLEEEVPMYASDDDDFDISLDDDVEQPEVGQAPTGGMRPGRLEPEMDRAEMDRLTLELDAADLPDAVTASLRAAQMLSDAPVSPPGPSPIEPETIPRPGHVTLEMDADSISTDFPPGLLEESMSGGAPRSPAAPEAPETQEATAFLQLQDVVLADDPAAAVEPDPTVVDPTMPIMPVSSAAVDGAVLTPEAHEPSASDMADVVEPALTTLDELRLQAMGRLPSFEDEWAPLMIESIPEDMFVLEDLPETIPPGHLTLELDASVLPAELASNLLADATSMSPCTTPQLPETLAGARLEPPLPPADAAPFADLDDITLPGHLILELDRSDMAAEVSSIILDSVQCDTPPGDMPAQMSSGADQTNDGAELLLDLDNLDCDAEKPA